MEKNFKDFTLMFLMSLGGKKEFIKESWRAFNENAIVNVKYENNKETPPLDLSELYGEDTGIYSLLKLIIEKASSNEILLKLADIEFIKNRKGAQKTLELIESTLKDTENEEITVAIIEYSKITLKDLKVPTFNFNKKDPFEVLGIEGFDSADKVSSYLSKWGIDLSTFILTCTILMDSFYSNIGREQAYKNGDPYLTTWSETYKWDFVSDYIVDSRNDSSYYESHLRDYFNSLRSDFFQNLVYNGLIDNDEFVEYFKYNGEKTPILIYRNFNFGDRDKLIKDSDKECPIPFNTDGDSGTMRPFSFPFHNESSKNHIIESTKKMLRTGVLDFHISLINDNPTHPEEFPRSSYCNIKSGTEYYCPNKFLFNDKGELNLEEGFSRLKDKVYNHKTSDFLIKNYELYAYVLSTIIPISVYNSEVPISSGNIYIDFTDRIKFVSRLFEVMIEEDFIEIQNMRVRRFLLMMLVQDVLESPSGIFDVYGRARMTSPFFISNALNFNKVKERNRETEAHPLIPFVFLDKLNEVYIKEMKEPLEDLASGRSTLIESFYKILWTGTTRMRCLIELNKDPKQSFELSDPVSLRELEQFREKMNEEKIVNIFLSPFYNGKYNKINITSGNRIDSPIVVSKILLTSIINSLDKGEDNSEMIYSHFIKEIIRLQKKFNPEVFHSPRFIYTSGITLTKEFAESTRLMIYVNSLYKRDEEVRLEDKTGGMNPINPTSLNGYYRGIRKEDAMEVERMIEEYLGELDLNTNSRLPIELLNLSTEVENEEIGLLRKDIAREIGEVTLVPNPLISFIDWRNLTYYSEIPEVRKACQLFILKCQMGED